MKRDIIEVIYDLIVRALKGSLVIVVVCSLGAWAGEDAEDPTCGGDCAALVDVRSEDEKIKAHVRKIELCGTYTDTQEAYNKCINRGEYE